MKIFALILVCATLPKVGTYHDTVDLIECNTVHCPQGFPAFTQMIYWDWSELEKQYVVRAWKLNNEVWVKSDEHKEQWMKILREYCDRYPSIKFNEAKARYRGDFDPVPGINFPIKRKDYWEMSFYYEGKRIVVQAKQFRLTNTQNDPERDNRAVLNENARTGINGFNRK